MPQTCATIVEQVTVYVQVGLKIANLAQFKKKKGFLIFLVSMYGI